MVLRFFFLKFNKATKSSFEGTSSDLNTTIAEAEDRESKETGKRVEKRKAGNRQRLAGSPLPVSLWAHITAWWSQVPRCKRRTKAQIRREEAGYASTPAIWLWRKKPNKTPLRRLSKSAAKPEPSRGASCLQPRRPAPAAPPPLSAGMQSGPNFRGRPIARRPASRASGARGGLGLEGFPSSSCWRELSVCLMQMSPGNPEPACSRCSVYFCIAEILF